MSTLILASPAASVGAVRAAAHGAEQAGCALRIGDVGMTARRRIFTGLALAVVTAVVAAGCSGGSTGSGGAQGTAAPPSAAATEGGSAPGATAGQGTAGPPRPARLVAVTTAGALVVLDSGTGKVVRTLRAGAGATGKDVAAVGDAVALTPDGQSVYFETGVGCQHQIMRIPITGGTATVAVQSGSVPAVSPDGTQLAFARQYFACSPDNGGTADYKVVVENLTTHVQRDYPLSPERVASGLPAPVTHLAWSADGSHLAVSVGSVEDNEGWALVPVNLAADSSYLPDTGSPGVPPTASAPKGSFYYEGVYLQDGNLFAVEQCCTGYPPVTTSVRLREIRPTGAVVRDVSTGLTDRTHTSLGVDASGHWLLYLSGADLEISQDGARPTTLASGFQAVDW